MAVILAVSAWIIALAIIVLIQSLSEAEPKAEDAELLRTEIRRLDAELREWRSGARTLY